MLGDFAISPISPRAATPPAASAPASEAATPEPAAAAASSKRPLVNPSLHLDLALNLVVLEFIDDKGDVTTSFPSQKQLKAYQAQQAELAARPRLPAASLGQSGETASSSRTS